MSGRQYSAYPYAAPRQLLNYSDLDAPGPSSAPSYVSSSYAQVYASGSGSNVGSSGGGGWNIGSSQHENLQRAGTADQACRHAGRPITPPAASWPVPSAPLWSESATTRRTVDSQPVRLHSALQGASCKRAPRTANPARHLARRDRQARDCMAPRRSEAVCATTSSRRRPRSAAPTQSTAHPSSAASQESKAHGASSDASPAKACRRNLRPLLVPLARRREAQGRAPRASHSARADSRGDPRARAKVED